MSPLTIGDKEAIHNIVRVAVLEAMEQHYEKNHKPLEKLVYIGLGFCILLGAASSTLSHIWPLIIK